MVFIGKEIIVKINDFIKENIIGDYLNGISNKELCEKYKLHRSTIQSLLLKNKINLRPRELTSRKHHIIDENFFNKINSEKKAYILGILYADGNIRNNGFEISLNETDKKILDDISKIIYDDIILTYRKPRKYDKTSNYGNGQYRLIVTSKKMKYDLITHGCVNAKTFKIRFPKFDDITQYPHFIRGYFDGDGCFTTSKYRKNVGVHITSNIHFCDELAVFLIENLNIKAISSLRYGSVGAVRIHKINDVSKFIDYIYQNATIYLERKKNKCEIHRNNIN